MTLVNTATGELVESITEADVDASIERVKRHAESIWDEWAWQVENRTWLIKGYTSWDEMRRIEYTSLNGVQAPRAERPELIARFRKAGLTQTQTAEALGLSRPTVARHDEPTYQPRAANVSNDTFADDADVIEAEIVDDEPPAPKPRRDDTDSAMTSLINDLRGPWSRGITNEARRMSPQARSFLIDALQSTLDKIREIHYEQSEV
ncbi:MULTISPECIES: helix-turn-helix transcriptional regulator [unclassified Microbacterium]|uniref:helix-turn-helix transcriptional regulator n=1 Tax=unclassified Microbacterium TaxID=2609290 RepID=UPI00301969E0